MQTLTQEVICVDVAQTDRRDCESLQQHEAPEVLIVTGSRAGSRSSEQPPGSDNLLWGPGLTGGSRSDDTLIVSSCRRSLSVMDNWRASCGAPQQIKGRMCEWSLTSRPRCARGVRPPEEHPIPADSVGLSSRHSIPRSSVCARVQWGALFSSSTMETRRALIPSSFPLSWFRARLLAGSVGDTVVSEQVSSPPDKQDEQHPFHLDSLAE
ncbi:unnamed protein product [Pleuronectes platessa]|uniref:Uncharacterized protein n=1 Tax=Pleuronectes platessa TaxID=8262 RepID=A0A9N7W1G8_PLEPL|nr:unnamed protein product [Pleuronectes platessa]